MSTKQLCYLRSPDIGFLYSTNEWVWRFRFPESRKLDECRNKHSHEATQILTLLQSFSDKSNNQQAHFPMRAFHRKPTASKEAPCDSGGSVDGIRHLASGKQFLLGFEAYGRPQEDQVTLGAFGTPACRYGALVFGCHRKFGDCCGLTVVDRRVPSSWPSSGGGPERPLTARRFGLRGRQRVADQVSKKVLV